MVGFRRSHADNPGEAYRLGFRDWCKRLGLGSFKVQRVSTVKLAQGRQGFRQSVRHFFCFGGFRICFCPPFLSGFLRLRVLVLGAHARTPQAMHIRFCLVLGDTPNSGATPNDRGSCWGLFADFVWVQFRVQSTGLNDRSKSVKVP